MVKLLYQGHGSFRLSTDQGTVVYVDPYAGNGYDKPADLILISHQHADHNQVDLVTKKAECMIVSNFEAIVDGKHQHFEIHDMVIEAVEAGNNQGHSLDHCVGYIISIEGLKLYFSGDTSKTDQMATFASKGLDYAFLCADGHYNMGLEEAAECAAIIGAKHNVPVHLKPGVLFDLELAEQFKGPNRLIIAAGDEVELK